MFTPLGGDKNGKKNTPHCLYTLQPHAHRERIGEAHRLEAAPRRQNGMGREQIACRLVVRKLLIENYDSNHDGKLDEQELAKLKRDARDKQEKLACHLLSADDASSGGKLHTTESRRLGLFLACKPTNAGQPAAAKSHETRQNVSITGESGRRKEADAPVTETGALPRVCDLPRSSIPVAFMAQYLIIENYDVNGNGKLDPQEIRRIKADGMHLYRTREQDLIEQYDLNRDGKLSHSECQIAITLCEHDRRIARALRHSGSPDERFPESCYDLEIILNLCREKGIDVEVRVDQQGDFRIHLIPSDAHESVYLP